MCSSKELEGDATLRFLYCRDWRQRESTHAPFSSSKKLSLRQASLRGRVSLTSLEYVLKTSALFQSRRIKYK